MRRYETPYAADWYATSLRWLMLVVLLLSLALRAQIWDPPFWVLAAMFAWNIFMSALAGMNMRMPAHRHVVPIVDFLLSALFLWTQNMQPGGASIWSAVIPIINGAIYFEMWGAFIPALLFAAMQFLLLDFSFSNEVLFTLTVGLAGGLIGRFGVTRVRTSRQVRVDAEERRRRAEAERLRAIYELSSTLTATLSYKRVLDSALDLGYNVLNPSFDPEEERDERLVSAVLLIRENELRVGSARRFTNADLRASLHGNDGIL